MEIWKFKKTKKRFATITAYDFCSAQIVDKAEVSKNRLLPLSGKVHANINEQIESGKVADETATLIKALLMLFNMMITIFLEKHTNHLFLYNDSSY